MFRPVRQSLVRTHPVTGRKSLFLSAHAGGIVGWPVPEARAFLRDLVEHMILSHHGTLEFGSPKVPMFLEAMLLHQIDNLDSKMEAMRAHIAKDRQATGVWTGYNPALERIVLKKQQYLAEPQEPAVAEPAPHLPTAPQLPAKAPPSSAFAAKLQGALKSES